MRDDEESAELRHEVRNLESKNRALKNMLSKAADDLDEIAESECDLEDTDKAKTSADRLRRAAESD